MLPAEFCFKLHHAFLLRWSAAVFSVSQGRTAEAIQLAILDVLNIPHETPRSTNAQSAWTTLSTAMSLDGFLDDPALKKLQLPQIRTSITPISPNSYDAAANPLISPILLGLHLVAQNSMLDVHDHEQLSVLISLICKLALIVRPEWADYWRRLYPNAFDFWPALGDTGE